MTDGAGACFTFSHLSWKLDLNSNLLVRSKFFSLTATNETAPLATGDSECFASLSLAALIVK